MTYIKFNDYWKTFFSIDMSNNLFVRIVDFYDLIFDKRFDVKCVNNMIRDLQLEENEISLLDETDDQCVSEIWKTKRKWFDYCLDDIISGSLEVKKVGVIDPDFWNSRTMDAANYRQYPNYVDSHIRNKGKFVLLKFNGIRITGVEE
jgi:hypothetical protein